MDGKTPGWSVMLGDVHDAACVEHGPLSVPHSLLEGRWLHTQGRWLKVLPDPPSGYAPHLHGSGGGEASGSFTLRGFQKV